MRPEKGFEEEMDEKHQDPRELFVDIGLLITEARTPHHSAKGRVEGPHCPPVSGTNDHSCDRHKEQCRKASDILRQQNILWKNEIPMRIDVLLFPDCEHGLREETIVEGASFECDENFKLLERWDIQLIKKRSTEKLGGFILGRAHLQAVRSYLHFSQLSSWLISGTGGLPLRVIYRIYAPGETVSYNFSQLPEVHKFPSADLGELVLSTTVAHLPRSNTPLSLTCQSPSPGLQHHLRYKHLLISSNEKKTKFVKEPSPSTSAYGGECSEKMDVPNIMDCVEKGRTGTRKSEKAEEKPPSGKKVDNQSSLKGKMRLQTCPLSKTPKRKVEQMSPTKPCQDKYSFTCKDASSTLTDTGVKPSTPSTIDKTRNTVVTTTASEPSPNGSVVKSCLGGKGSFKTTDKCETPMKKLSYQKPVTLTVSTGNTHIASKRLPSPKVLVTGTGKPEPTMYKKRCLDVAFGSRIDEDAKGFDAAFEQLKEYTAREINDLVKPLSPSDLDAYISSLSSYAQRHGGISKIDDIPTTKCSFFLGEGIENPICLSPDKTSAKSDDLDIDDSNDTKSHISDESAANPQLASSGDHFEADTTDKLVQTCATESQNFSTDKKTDISVLPVTTQPKHVRALFQKSFSTYEVDEDVFHQESRNDRQKSQMEMNFRFCRDGQDVEDNASHKSTKASETISPEHVIDSYYANRLVCHDGLGRKKCQTDAQATPDCDSLNKMNPDTTTNNQSDTVKHFSIPCKVGSVNQTLSTLVQDLEAMEIDDENSASNSDTAKMQEKSLPSSRVGSPVLDLEVERHLHCDVDGAMVANGATPSPTPPATSCPTHTCDTESADCDTNSTAKRNFSLSLCKQLLRKEFELTVKNEILSPGKQTYKNLPSPDDITNYHCMMGRSTSAIFNVNTGLPSRSSPAPMKKNNGSRFDYDCSLTNVRAIKNAISCSKLTLQSENNTDDIEDPKVLSTSAPASTNCLLGNFEESVLNGRIEPVGVVDGFTVEIGAGGLFCPKHVVLPVAAYFFQLSDDNAPSPYLGHVNLEALGKRGYHIPRTGTVQVTLFNPNKTVVKMFVVLYDLSDMPANCQTFLRQRTIYMPVDRTSTEPSYLRYLIHLRFASSKSGKVYLHTDIRLIFARDKFEFDPQVASYELRSFTEGPQNPKFSPRR